MLLLVTGLLAGLVSGCQADFTGLRLTVATGSKDGVYDVLGNVLADAWAGQLRMPRPEVRQTAGSVDNLGRLVTGSADIGFSAADAATETINTPGQRGLRALARMHDDYLQLVVRADSRAGHLADLRGLRVSIGSPKSGVELIARRLLETAGLGENDLVVAHLGLSESLAALRSGSIDAFFWSGGLPTAGITELAARLPLRLLDLADVLPELRERYPVYRTATLPASAYGLSGGPVSTLAVPNFLLVTDAMSDDVAEALTRGLFAAREPLDRANPAAQSIDARSAIETASVPLHPGARRYYQDAKV
ncbi:hypothetical protein LX83_007181 [Goodfellowiella coeruleoviolacea]|uniref:C4-dicarboxylate ABC transporter substrate-binding protein n=1 Tax=Goodfellowiella coeruleoviolacea TaxID=334858 RepID=A0AAE3GLM3_9PSEU|nr:hypothetical protein [Goodfellowiella coeruleoviolacea]